MAFTAADVKTLREMTSVGMMDCKKALVECDGDMDKAVEWLREKGLAKAAKKAGRIAAEGMSYALTENGVGVVVEVNCETDFCAKSDLFVAFVKDIAKVIAEQNPADVDALMNCKYVGSELTVSETMPEKVMSIGENLQIRRFVRFSENTSVGYVHAGGKIGVLVNLAVEGGIDATEIAKDVAMQIAAAAPAAIDRSGVDAAALEHEKEVLRKQALEEGKPEKIVDRIVAGQIEKYYKEVCLLDQQFVKDGDKTITSLMNETAKAAGTTLDIVRYVRFERGEGIEKRKDDLAAEIAAMKKA